LSRDESVRPTSSIVRWGSLLFATTQQNPVTVKTVETHKTPRGTSSLGN
jgi:hypothetical protein